MQVISFINMKGGVGKTTLAMNISDCLSRVHKYKVLTIDVDPQFSATQCLYAENHFHDLLHTFDTTVDIFRQRGTDATHVSGLSGGIFSRAPKPLAEIVPQEINENWYFLPTSFLLYSITHRQNDKSEYALRDYIDTLIEEGGYDFIILDTPPTPSTWMKSAIIASDFYVVPVKPDPLSLISIDILKGYVNGIKFETGVGAELMGVILNMVDERSTLVTEAISRLKVKKISLFNQYIPLRANIARYQVDPQNRKFILDLPDHKTRENLTKITDELVARLHDPNH